MRKIIVTIILVMGFAFSYGQAIEKPKPVNNKVDTLPPNFALVGSINDFQLLLAAVVSPDDVTANQRKALDAWIRKIQALPKPK